MVGIPKYAERIVKVIAVEAMVLVDYARHDT
jgi:hypothetical protein